ncbi:Uncharacterised protein [Escherichia coli]|nr:Uncharacterised protein [Escherichia coli]
MKAKKAADQKALVIATTDVSLFTKGEEIDLKLLFGMFEPHEKPCLFMKTNKAICA